MLCFNLIFKQVVPQDGTIARSPGQLTFADIERIQQVTLDQFKVQQGEFFVLILSIEANKCSHVCTYAV